ncbi:STAS domain-containing protein [Actibacterium lipolyticum]|uniref:Anti-sigma factor antagonist n=1 Tax=Actibacterium lipolyticum TaxID=1524263 RepID=A0A238KUN3_9RHOB|nr:STAS domain-containing protein [Actibacterium lipolyticum]SMX46301.1 Putative anti-sigma factor antagonist [Actibacterium lipolyticum]
MDLQAEVRDQALVVAVQENRVDAAVAIQFKDKMREVTATPHERVVMDLSLVDFLDSSGLGAVVAVMKFLAPGRKLELAGLTPTVAKVFRLTRMDTVFTLHDTIESAFSGDADAA